MDAKTRKKVAASAQSVPTPGKDFLLASLDMSWRLAIVVLVPIVGGFYLDKGLGMLPVFTILGFFVAMAGMALVVWQQVKGFKS